MDVQKAIEQVISLAHLEMEKNGELTNCAYMIKGDKIHITPMLMDKVDFINAMRRMAEDVRPDVYLFVFEAWTAPKATDESLNRLSPSERPDRKEAVFVQIETEMSAKIQGWDIIRDDQGKYIRLERRDEPPGMDISGRFVGVLHQAKLAPPAIN